jgi:DNA polymerase III sliding clamp (beta) subunit (PCNA family)
VSYLLQAINALPDGMLILNLSNTNASILLEDESGQNQYIVMPMRI